MSGFQIFQMYTWIHNFQLEIFILYFYSLKRVTIFYSFKTKKNIQKYYIGFGNCLMDINSRLILNVAREFMTNRLIL